VRATPDGYTLLLVGLSNAMNATLYKKLNFNFNPKNDGTYIVEFRTAAGEALEIRSLQARQP
jgi:hypothetical protein